MILGRKKESGSSRPGLDRRQALEAQPVLNQVISLEHDADGNAILNIPRKRTRMVKRMAKVFHLPPYKKIELDELGTFVVNLCDGTNSVSDIIDGFARHFQLDRREAEVSMVSFLKTLAKKGIIVFVVPGETDEKAGQTPGSE